MRLVKTFTVTTYADEMNIAFAKLDELTNDLGAKNKIHLVTDTVTDYIISDSQSRWERDQAEKGGGKKIISRVVIYQTS